MRSRTTRPAIVAVLMLLSAALPAAAQPNPRGDIAGSWGLLAASEVAAPAGWVAAFGGRVNGWLTIAGEVGGNYKSESEGGVSLDVSEHAFLGGTRFGPGGDRTLRPFFQVLAGVTRASAGADAFGLSIDASKSFFTVQTGAGLDVGLTPHVAIRVQADIRMLTGDGVAGQFRFATGVAFALGGR